MQKFLSLKGRILAGSAILFVAGFLCFFSLPTPASATSIVSQLVNSAKDSTYRSLSSGGGSDYIFWQKLGTGLSGSATEVVLSLDFQANSYSTRVWVMENNDNLDNPFAGDRVGEFVSNTLVNSTSGSTQTYTYTFTGGEVIVFNPAKYYYIYLTNASGLPYVKVAGSGASTYANGSCFKYTPSTYTACTNVADMYFDVPVSYGGYLGHGGIVTQVTPVDGSNNYPTINFTGTYSNDGTYNTIHVSYQSTYPDGQHAFERDYPIPTTAGVSLNYSFSETFPVDYTFGYLMYLTNSVIDSDVTTSEYFGASSSTVIQGATTNGVGTVSNTASDGTVTGSGTTFLSMLQIGDVLTLSGQTCTVLSISSDTVLECTVLASAHTAVAFTFVRSVDIGISYGTCSTFDLFCYLKNFATWFFVISPSTLTGFSSLVNFTTPSASSLASRLPFAYMYDLGTVYNELFANSGSMEYAVSANTGALGTINFISASQISAVPFASTIKTIIGYLIYFMTIMTLYRMILKVHSKTS